MLEPAGYAAEAARLDRARSAVAERLGRDRLDAVRRRGASMTAPEVTQAALVAINTALARASG